MEPASFTLASHVPIFIALFISPGIAVAVSLGTVVGFMLAGFPLIIALRALSHVVFAVIGGLVIKRNRLLIEDKVKSQIFSFFIGILHGASEMALVTFFYFGGALPQANYTDGFFYSIFLLVGVGTLLHSMIDFFIAQIVWKGLGKRTKKLAQLT